MKNLLRSILLKKSSMYFMASLTRQVLLIIRALLYVWRCLARTIKSRLPIKKIDADKVISTPTSSDALGGCGGERERNTTKTMERRQNSGAPLEHFLTGGRMSAKHLPSGVPTISRTVYLWDCWEIDFIPPVKNVKRGPRGEGKGKKKEDWARQFRFSASHLNLLKVAPGYPK